MFANKEGRSPTRLTDAGSRCIQYYEPLDWYIVSRAELSDFTGPIDTIRNTIVALMIASMAIGAVIAILFGRSISGPLHRSL
jgi:hypothetical protein